MNEQIPNKSQLLISSIAVALTMLITVWLNYKNETLSNFWLIIYLFIIVWFELSVIYRISNSKNDLEHKDIFKVVYTYILLNFTIIAWFAFAVISFNSFSCDTNCRDSNLNMFVDAFYYSTVSFSTIGFGDILPTNTAGKLLLVSEALISSINSATFISVVFLKFKVKSDLGAKVTKHTRKRRPQHR